MKILQFGKFYYPTFGGMERAMFEIVEGLNESGIECDVLCSNTINKNEISTFGSYSVHRTASYGMLNSTSITPKLIYKLWQMGDSYDVIDVHHPDPMAFLAIFLVRPKAKLVIHWQSDIVRQKLMGKLFLPLQNWVLKRADSVVLASQAYGKNSADLKEYQEKIAVVPIGIDDKLLQVDNHKLEEIQEKYREKKIIFALGRLVSYKGFDYLIEATKYLDDNYIVILGGSGPQEQYLRNLIEEYGLHKRVEMIGYMSEAEKYAYFQASTIFCLPSVTKAEAFGVVLVEAMAFAKPTVLSYIQGSGMNWVCKDGITGLQVEPRDALALAQAIKTITAEQSRYMEYSHNAKERFEELFTREKMVELLSNLYGSILEK